MKKSRFSESHIIAILKQAEVGTPVPKLCREYGMSSALFCKWRSRYGRMDASILPSERVIRSPEQIIDWRGRPDRIRCDNGPEYVSATLMAWASRRGIHVEFIQPGKPQ